MGSQKSRDDEIYEQGVHDGQQADLLDQVAHSMSKGFTLNPRETDIYNKGYDYGVAHRPEIAAFSPPSSERIREDSAEASDVARSSDETGCAQIIAVVVVGLIIIAVVLWLLANVVLPVLLLNAAAICAILALAYKANRTLFSSLALVGGCYLLVDVANGWLSANFVNNVVKTPTWLTAFVYVNAAAVALSTWQLVRPLLATAATVTVSNKRNGLLLSSGAVGLICAAGVMLPVIYHTVPNPFVDAPNVADTFAQSGVTKTSIPEHAAGEQIQFRQIPAGTFTMGCTPSDSECDPDESPPHRVTLSKAFMMAQTETTNAQYGRCVAEGACSPPTPSTDYNDPGKRDHPVVNVTWGDATTFCRWAGARLPTEAEWEYTARGGRTESRYPWGASISHDSANYKETGGRDQWSGTSPVGSFEPIGYGLYDMSGNAWEWVADWYGEYPQTHVRNPSGPSSGPRRVLRGGSWSSVPRWLRVSFRVRGAPGYRLGSDGFRCARNVEDASESSINAMITKTNGALSVTIGEFNKIPDDFAVGAGCSYSKTRTGKPVFIEDMGGSAVMMLNGDTVRLKWVEQTQATENGLTNIYTGDNFEVSKSTTTVETWHEGASEEGYITVKSKDGGAVTKERIYGACGA
jgi:formylglycine-generating enzyme required for sulfatase activity